MLQNKDVSTPRILTWQHESTARHPLPPSRGIMPSTLPSASGATPYILFPFSTSKWMYEVQIGTSGLMQLGWCTSTCKFTREEGVGDTKQSYAYDGYREAKWKARANTKYGQAWEADDVITCLLDLDNRTNSFLLNGQNLGIAFEGIPTGPGIAYFPGLSLAYKEIAYCNFGSRPLKYPVDGYRPIQDPPSDANEAEYLVKSLSSLSNLKNTRPDLDRQLDVITRQVIMACVVQFLGTIVKSAYNIESYLLPYLYSLCQNEDQQKPLNRDLHVMLCCIWQYTEARDARDCINQIFGSVLRSYRTSPVHVTFIDQSRDLNFMLALFQHKQTRRNLSLHCSYPFL